MVQSSFLLKPESPFYKQALRRAQYRKHTTPHQIKGRELDVLVEVIHRERRRVPCLESPSSCSVQEILDDGLDWTMIAKRLSAGCGNEHTADECRVKWEELNSSTTSRGCHVPQPTHVWSPDSDQSLKMAVERYGFDNWLMVAKAVSENVTASQCEGRFCRMLDQSVKRGSWTREEDTRLQQAVEVHGHSWTNVASTISGRTNNQCRERWVYRQRTSTSTVKINNFLGGGYNT